MESYKASCKMNVIVGNNGTGKTRFLLNLLAQSSNTAVSNLKGLDSYRNLGVSEEKRAVIEEYLCVYSVVLSDSSVLIEDSRQKYSKAISDLVFLLCIDSPVLILDNPDLMLEKNEDWEFYNLLVRLSSFYDEIWVATHDNLYLETEGINCFSIENGTELNSISVGEAFEVCDCPTIYQYAACNMPGWF